MGQCVSIEGGTSHPKERYQVGVYAEVSDSQQAVLCHAKTPSTGVPVTWFLS